MQKPSKYSCNPRKKKKIQVNFYFKDVFMKNTQKEMLKLNNKKFDISNKTIKEKADIFAEYSCSSINGWIKSSTFPSYMTVADIVSFYEKGKNDTKDARLTKGI